MAEANWNIMIYIAADDVLANFAVESLKQVKREASNRVVVTAQFDADQERNIPLLVFDDEKDKNGLIADNKKGEIAGGTNMADPGVLQDFINWAYGQRKARHYCLVLWGHGPELLFDDYLVTGARKMQKSFLTPSDLKKALAGTQLVKDGKRFDVIGIDACSMSMVELASEIRTYADYLIASQEEIPDFSFPYDRLLRTFGETDKPEHIEAMCRSIPKTYIEVYSDYILSKQTNMPSITLSSLRLGDNVGAITGPIQVLTKVLLDAMKDAAMRHAIVEARANSKSFVAGLYVDLVDFCKELRGQCLKNNCGPELIAACESISAVIRSSAFVIANETSQDKHCHGVSIYFPYLTDPESDVMQEPLAPLVKGGIDVLNKGGIDVLNKGGIDVLNKGGIDVLNKVRRQRIGETEQYYYNLELPSTTKWGEFIKHGWSRCLAEYAEAQTKSPADASEVLNERYSGQQCALNLLSLCRELEAGRKPFDPPDAGEGSSDRPPDGPPGGPTGDGKSKWVNGPEMPV